MNWMILLAAGLCECGWAVGMKYTCGFTRLWPSVFTVAAMARLDVAIASVPGLKMCL